MKLYWADYHKDTRHLSRSEHGAYFLLLGEAWNRGGYLPDDDVLLARLSLSTPDEWAAMKDVVMAFFRPAPKGRWRHKRVAEELASYIEVSRKRKAAGKIGGAANLGKTRGNQQANATAIAKQKPTKPEPEPEPERRELKLSVVDAFAPTRDAEFEAWWSLYPRKVGKLAARKAYDRARQEATGEALRDGVKRAIWPADEKYIPNPATWLNSGRWMDAAPAPKPMAERRVGFV